jgi:hypothetical protein
MSLWDALRMNMMISYQELVRTFLSIAMDTFHHYPWLSADLLWSEMHFTDFEIIDCRMNWNWIANVFVLADDADVPVFKSNLRLILNTIYVCAEFITRAIYY